MRRSQISWTTIAVWIAVFALPAFADNFKSPHPLQIAFAVGDKVEYICESASLRISETPDSKQTGPSVAVVKGDHDIWVSGPESGEWIRVRVLASQSAAYDGWVKTACVKSSLAQPGGVATVSRASRTLSTGQLSAIGITPLLISHSRSEFAGAVLAATPAVKPGIGTVVGTLQKQALGGNVTDGSAEVRRVFPSATNNQLLALRAAIFAGLLDRLTEVVNAQDKAGVSALKRTKHTYVLIERRLLEALKNKGSTQNSLIHQIRM